MGKGDHVSVRREPHLREATIKAVLLVLGVLAVVFVGSKIQDRSPFTPPNGPPSLTNTADPSATATIPFSVILPTTIPFSTATEEVIGTNIPDEFSARDWHDNRSICDGQRAKYDRIGITGVEISGPVVPYQFMFSQDDKIISTTTVSPVNGSIRFAQAVLVKRGKPVHVTVTFHLANVESAWEGDLYYPFRDRGCPNS